MPGIPVCLFVALQCPPTPLVQHVLHDPLILLTRPSQLAQLVLLTRQVVGRLSLLRTGYRHEKMGHSERYEVRVLSAIWYSTLSDCK